MRSRLIMLAISIPTSLMVGCASEDSFRESIEVQVDGRQVLSSINQKSSKSAWEQDAELGALTESACSLPKELSQAKANLTNKSSGQGLSQLSASVSSNKPSLINKNSHSTSEFQNDNQSGGYSFKESVLSQKTNVSQVTMGTSLSSIKLQPLDSDALSKEGVDLSVVSNTNGHLDLLSLLVSEYGFKNNAVIIYRKSMVDPNNKAKLEVNQAISIKEGILTCREITEESIEIGQ